VEASVGECELVEEGDVQFYDDVGADELVCSVVGGDSSAYLQQVA
jgi:hypothetical protein